MIRKPDPDSLAAAILLAFLATAGLFYVNILAALVDGLHRALHFSTRDAGLVASANVYGAAAGSLIAALLGPRLPWKRTALCVLGGMIAIDLFSMLLTSPGPLIAVRFAHGLTGGLLVGVGLSLIGRTKAPDRGFGVLLFLQYGLGGLGTIVLPRLATVYGMKALFVALIAMSLATLAMVPFIQPSTARQAETAPAQAVRGGRWLVLTAIAAMFLYQAAAMGVNAYVLGMGEAFGLQPDFVSATVGSTTWVGLFGAGAVVVLGTRFGRFAPIAGAVLLTAAQTVGFIFWGHDPLAWTVLNGLGALCWAWVIPYIYGLCSAFDTQGRTTLWAGFLSKLGLATGPAVGAFILAETHYERLLWTSAAVCLLCGLAAAPAALRLDRLHRGGPQPAAASGAVEPA